MKNCPFCIEDIQDAATVCKHCGTDLVTMGGKNKPPSPMLYNLSFKKVGVVAGQYFRYQMSFGNCKYNWFLPRKILAGVMNQKHDPDNFYDQKIWCQDLRSMLKVQIVKVNQNETAKQYIDAVYEEKTKNITEIIGEGVKTESIHNLNPNTDGILIRVTGRSVEVEEGFCTSTIIIPVKTELEEWVLILHLNSSLNYGAYALEDLMSVYKTFQWVL